MSVYIGFEINQEVKLIKMATRLHLRGSIDQRPSRVKLLFHFLSTKYKRKDKSTKITHYGIKPLYMVRIPLNIVLNHFLSNLRIGSHANGYI